VKPSATEAVCSSLLRVTTTSTAPASADAGVSIAASSSPPT